MKHVMQLRFAVCLIYYECIEKFHITESSKGTHIIFFINAYIVVFSFSNKFQ